MGRIGLAAGLQFTCYFTGGGRRVNEGGPSRNIEERLLGQISFCWDFPGGPVAKTPRS